MNINWSIRRYKPADETLWNALATQSRQGTLLHTRGYMDYHSDRFRDCSLIATRKGDPISILPANLDAEGRLWSHQGLTYGGWLTPTTHFDGTDMLHLFDAWLGWCRDEGIKEIIYKAVPGIYHWIPAEEDLYALFRFGAKTETVNLSSVIDYRAYPDFNEQQKRNLRKAENLNPWIREQTDVREFMNLVESCLSERHGAKPVHTADELQRLTDIFPESIRIYLAGTGREAEAGVCLYLTNGVAHCQYIATSDEGRKNGTLAYLFHKLIQEFSVGMRYFDFGTSNEDSGRVLNPGLLHQKYGLGGRGIAYQTFKLTI